jgi:hypothetical protein
MRYRSWLMVLMLAAMVALSAGCRRGGKEKAGTKPSQPPQPSASATKPGPVGGPPMTPPEPPEVKPGDIATKAVVVFGFYLEKGPLTPQVKWDASKGQLTISHIYSSVNMGSGYNTRVAAEKVTKTGVRNLMGDYAAKVVKQLPEVKVFELHVLFKGKDVGRLTATRKEIEDAMAAAGADPKNTPGGERWMKALFEKLSGAWIAPKLTG